MRGEPQKRATAARARQEAFTLIEVLVVVAIIALLLAVLLPSLARAREQSKTLVCRTRLRELYRGHALYAADSRNRFPHWDNWLWDGKGNERQALFNVNIYSKWGGSRPADATSWVQLGTIYRYVRNKETYFCPNDRKRRLGNSIGTPSNGKTPIHSYVRFIEPHDFMAQKLTNKATKVADEGKLTEADFINPDSLRPGIFSTVLPTAPPDGPFTTTPDRMGLLFEEYPGFDETQVGGNLPNRVNALNDAYSGFYTFDDYMVARHGGLGQINFWDGHTAMIDGKRFNNYGSTDKYAAWMCIGAPRSK